MTVPEVPAGVNSVTLDLDLSPKLVRKTRQEVLATTFDLMERASPDVVTDELTAPTIQDGMPLHMREVLGKEPVAVDYRITYRSNSDEPLVTIRFREDSAVSKAQSSDLRSGLGIKKYFDVTRYPDHGRESRLMPCEDILWALDDLLPDANNNFSALGNPDYHFDFTRIAKESGRIMLALSEKATTEHAYHGKEIQVCDPSLALPPTLLQRYAQSPDHSTFFEQVYGARLVVKSMTRDTKELDESVALSIIAPLELREGTVLKEFHYRFPLHRASGYGILRLSSRDLSSAALKNFARHSYRDDKPAQPAKAALELVQENHLNGFGRTYAPHDSL